jgi:hypothetical protein
MPNRLAAETSPYLRQHADNPVDWYPWGQEALERARAEDKPILLSIGYAACHWCHVMAHESFENPATAELMNRHYINIKVDREERPDLDGIYMNAVVAMTGQGGWPMTVIMTPDCRPFFGGTYFPPAPRFGMPAFSQVLLGVAQAWREQRDNIEASATEITNALRGASFITGAAAPVDDGLFDQALNNLLRTFDSRLGGFGGAPKFPPSMTLEFLLRAHLARGDALALHMAELTLTQMARGGMYDHLGGGFARYSTDDRWLVPHFEKMLYDNALLARVYLHAWQITGNPLFRQVTEETLDFVARELRHDDGGFYSSYDADSEGEEGKFYVWTAAEIGEALGDQAQAFMIAYDVTPGGNWEGRTILNTPLPLDEVAASLGRAPAEFAEAMGAARRQLYDLRARRVWPGLDDKVITAWNGLMLAAFAEAGRALGRGDYTAVAVSNAAFLHRTMRRENGRLLRTWKAGAQARYNAYLEDYAYLAEGLLALYQTTFDPVWFAWARELADLMLAHFRDGDAPGFYDTSDDHERLLERPKDVQDNATPSGNAMAATALLKLGLYTGERRYWDAAEAAIGSVYEAMARYPNAFAQWLTAASFIAAAPREVAVIGRLAAADTRALLDAVFSGYRPDLVVAAGPDSSHGTIIPLLEDRPQRDGRATAYVCRRFACQQPVTDPTDLLRQLEA